MSRVLWIGDAGCHTGFARVTHQIGERLVRDFGHDLHVLAINYEGDTFPGALDPSRPTPLKMYRPTKVVGNDVFGQSRFVELLAEVMPDVVVLVHDPYTVTKFLFRNKRDSEMLLARFRPLLAYLPIDGTNYPETWNRVPQALAELPALDGGNGRTITRVAMSRHGQQYLGGPLVYHGVDTELYRPVSEARPMITSTGVVVTNKKDAKRAFGLDPDSFLVLRVDRNSERKNFADTWKALVPVMKRHTEVVAWFHCAGQGDGLELPELFSRDPDTAPRFFLPGRFNTKSGWTEGDLAILYNAADVYVSTSGGEGFGLTLAEAAATGIPIIAQNVSAIPEVVGDGGLLLDPERLITVFSGHDNWLPDVGKFSDSIEYLYGSRGARRALGDAGRQHVTASFSWDIAASKFSDLITGLTQEAPGSPRGGIDLDGSDDA
jgi:glycosyltransferase involved in cell wall biosynthesis